MLHAAEVEVLLGAVMTEAVERDSFAVNKLDSHSALVGMIRGGSHETDHVGPRAGNVAVYIEFRYQRGFLGCDGYVLKKCVVGAHGSILLSALLFVHP